MKAEITAGQVSDYIGYGDVMEDDLPPPKVLIPDKGYDSDAIREDVEARGGTPVIPARRNRRNPVQIDGYIYALHNMVERCINKLKKSEGWLPATTKPQPAISALSKSHQHAYGSSNCRHDLIAVKK